MSTLAAPTATTRLPARAGAALRCAQAALCVGAVAAVALAAIELFVTTSPDEGKFHHAGDWAMTADGIPYMVCLLVLLPALRSLQLRRDGRRGLAGIALAGLGALVLLGIFVYGLAYATASPIGPAYMLGSFATIVGVVLFVAGSWRIGLLPRWLLAVWAVGWTIGGALPVPGPWPLLLAAAYLTMAALLPRRLARSGPQL